MSNIETALQLASASTMNIDTVTTQSVTLLNTELNNGRWVVLDLIYQVGSDYYGHVIVLKSYNSSNGEYTYWDPWSNLDGTIDSTEIFVCIHLPYSNYDYYYAGFQRCQ